MLRLLASLCLAFACVSAQAATLQMTTATSAEFATVYGTAVTGDTIKFPLNGSATWSTSATVSKALTIDGNGTTLTAGATLSNGFFYVTGFTSTALMRVTGFTFAMVNLTSDRHALKLENISLTQLRIDHNTFTNGDIPIEVGGCLGVIDSNNFTNGTSGIYFTAGTRAQADASWVTLAAGTANAFFIETNTFLYNTSWLGANENNSVLDTYNGGKVVFRYNTITATSVPVSWTGPLGVIVLHGNAAGGAPTGYWEGSALARRGQSVVEVYNNTINATRCDFLGGFRGSSCLIHDNVLNTTMFNPRLLMYEEEAWLTGQFSPLRTAWPAEDQIFNTFIWNNTLSLNGVPNVNYVEVASDGSATFIQQDRDYFLHAPQATGGKETFTSANGAAGTAPTNGTTYPNSGTMVFTSSGANAYYPYTPYPYPFIAPASTPIPDPSSITSTSATSTSVTVVATTTTGGTAPNQYNFAVNGTYAGWQASQSHTFTGLTPSTSYAFKVKAQDSATPTPNATTESAVSNVSTTGTIPTVSSVTVPSAGTTVVVGLSASCTTGTGGSGGFTATVTTGAALTFSGVAGSGSSTYTLTASRTILATDVFKLNYAQPGNGIEATVGGADLASFTLLAVTNSSTQVAPTAPTVTAIAIPSAGTTTNVTMNQSATVGAGGSGGFTAVASGGALTLTYLSGSPGTAYVLTNSRTVAAGETVQVTYVQPGNGIEGTVGGLDLASFSLRAVANGSTALVPTTTPTPPAPDRQPKPKKKR